MVDMTVMVITFIAACALLDRLRGMDTFVPAAVTKLMYGFLVGSFISYMGDGHQWYPVAFAALFALGSAPGWGAPMGAALDNRPMREPFERWQKGDVLQTNTVSALLVRGMIWTFPTMLLILVDWGHWLWLVPAIAMPVCFTAAPYIGRRYGPKKWWAATEFIRGGMFGTIVGFGALL